MGPLNEPPPGPIEEHLTELVPVLNFNVASLSKDKLPFFLIRDKPMYYVGRVFLLKAIVYIFTVFKFRIKYSDMNTANKQQNQEFYIYIY